METEDNAHFLKMENLKAKKDHMNLLESRLLFLMSNKIKGANDEDYLMERMTSRSFYGDGRNSSTQRSREFIDNCWIGQNAINYDALIILSNLIWLNKLHEIFNFDFNDVC